MFIFGDNVKKKNVILLYFNFNILLKSDVFKYDKEFGKIEILIDISENV